MTPPPQREVILITRSTSRSVSLVRSQPSAARPLMTCGSDETFARFFFISSHAALISRSGGFTAPMPSRNLIINGLASSSSMKNSDFSPLTSSPAA